jgi:hypothetical protein
MKPRSVEEGTVFSTRCIVMLSKQERSEKFTEDNCVVIAAVRLRRQAGEFFSQKIASVRKQALAYCNRAGVASRAVSRGLARRCRKERGWALGAQLRVGLSRKRAPNARQHGKLSESDRRRLGRGGAGTRRQEERALADRALRNFRNRVLRFSKAREIRGGDGTKVRIRHHSLVVCPSAGNRRPPCACAYLAFLA